MIEHQMEELGNQLDQHLMKLQEDVAQWQPSIDCQALSNAINECVKNNQQRLRDEFNHRIEMLKRDWHDHFLIAKVYALKPDGQVIQLEKQI